MLIINKYILFGVYCHIDKMKNKKYWKIILELFKDNCDFFSAKETFYSRLPYQFNIYAEFNEVSVIY